MNDIEKLKIAREALDRLSRLGCGGKIGNGDGHRIAINALEAIASTCQCSMCVQLVGDGYDACNPEYAASVCEPEPDEIPAGDIGQAAALYQHIRTLSPREFTALWTQALAGARLDDLVGESMKARNG